MTPEDCQSLEDYIAFFRAIPEERWCEGTWKDNQGRKCAEGWLGCSAQCPYTASDSRLTLLLGESLAVVNDGEHPDYQQPTPKARALAYLEDVLNGRAE